MVIETVKVVKDDIWIKAVEEGRVLIDNYWALGDLALKIASTAKYGENAIFKFANEIGCLSGSLYQYMVTAKAIRQPLRNKYKGKLSFFHFFMLATSSIPEAKWDGICKRGADDELSVAKFKAMVDKLDETTSIEGIKKAISVKFPGVLGELLNECLTLCAKKMGKDNTKDPKVLEGLLVASKEYLDAVPTFGVSPDCLTIRLEKELLQQIGYGESSLAFIREKLGLPA